MISHLKLALFLWSSDTGDSIIVEHKESQYLQSSLRVVFGAIKLFCEDFNIKI
jgi:hypothetical protein